MKSRGARKHRCAGCMSQHQPCHQMASCAPGVERRLLKAISHVLLPECLHYPMLCFLIVFKLVNEVKYLLHPWNSQSLYTCSDRVSLRWVPSCWAQGGVLLLHSAPALWLGSPEKPSRRTCQACAWELLSVPQPC